MLLLVAWLQLQGHGRGTPVLPVLRFISGFFRIWVGLCAGSYWRSGRLDTPVSFSLFLFLFFVIVCYQTIQISHLFFPLLEPPYGRCYGYEQYNAISALFGVYVSNTSLGRCVSSSDA